MYSPYLIDWYDVFPREQTLIVRMEDYAADKLAVINNIFNHLKVGMFPAVFTLLI